MKKIKRLSKCIGIYKKNSILSPVFVSLEVIMECLIPFIAARLLAMIQTEDYEITTTAIYGGALVVLSILSLCFGILAGRHCAIASCGFAKNLRNELFENSQNFSFENIDKFSSSSLVTRMTTDVTNVQHAFMMIIRTAIRSPLMFIFSIIMAFSLGGSMAIIFVIVAPLLLFILFTECFYCDKQKVHILI